VLYQRIIVFLLSVIRQETSSLKKNKKTHIFELPKLGGGGRVLLYDLHRGIIPRKLYSKQIMSSGYLPKGIPTVQQCQVSRLAVCTL